MSGGCPEVSGRYLECITKVLEDVWKVSACCKEGSEEYKESLLKARSSQDRCSQGRKSQFRTGPFQKGQARTGQVMPGRVKMDQVRTGQVRTGQVSAGQSGQIRTDSFR